MKVGIGSGCMPEIPGASSQCIATGLTSATGRAMQVKEGEIRPKVRPENLKESGVPVHCQCTNKGSIGVRVKTR